MASLAAFADGLPLYRFGLLSAPAIWIKLLWSGCSLPSLQQLWPPDSNGITILDPSLFFVFVPFVASLTYSTFSWVNSLCLFGIFHHGCFFSSILINCLVYSIVLVFCTAISSCFLTIFLSYMFLVLNAIFIIIFTFLLLLPLFIYPLWLSIFILVYDGLSMPFLILLSTVSNAFFTASNFTTMPFRCIYVITTFVNFHLSILCNISAFLFIPYQFGFLCCQFVELLIISTESFYFLYSAYLIELPWLSKSHACYVLVHVCWLSPSYSLWAMLILRNSRPLFGGNLSNHYVGVLLLLSVLAIWYIITSCSTFFLIALIIFRYIVLRLHIMFSPSFCFLHHLTNNTVYISSPLSHSFVVIILFPILLISMTSFFTF